jgi:hypothetical protein
VRKLVFAVTAVVVAAALSGHSAAQPAPAPEPSGPPAADAAQPADAATAPPGAGAPVLAPPSLGSPSQHEPAAPQQPPLVHGRLFSESTALWLSLGVSLASWTAISVGVAAADKAQGESAGPLATIGVLGAFLGPSAGHWYRGALLSRGMIPRVLGGVVMVFGFGLGSSCEGDSCDTSFQIFLGGAALVVVGSIDDIVMAPYRVRKHNQSLEGISLVPIVTPHSAGIALGARF